jgi:hypothetical protein
MASDARRLVESVLGGHMTSQVWTGTYAPVFAFTPQGFSVGAVLPMLLYLFRWGHRRGRGQFTNAFKPDDNTAPTVGSVVSRLSKDPRFESFSSATSRLILGDFLLTSTLENRRKREGHFDQVQRVFANHYLSSWIDLPATAAHLRGVPEMIVALLNGQEEGEVVEPFVERGSYRVGVRVQDSRLLKAFAPGVQTRGAAKNDLRSDEFDENADVAIDQLVTVRLAQMCGEAPATAVGKGEPGPVPNQRPLAKRAAQSFKEDLSIFLDCYGNGETIPRPMLISMIESAFAIGLSTIILSTTQIMGEWVINGGVENDDVTSLMPIFIDASATADADLRNLSELSGVLVRRALVRLPPALMHARLLDFYIRQESDIPPRELPKRSPDATEWMRLLGTFIDQTHEEARAAEKYFRSKLRGLRDAEIDDDSSALFAELDIDDLDVGDYGRALSEVLTRAFTATESAKDKIYVSLTSALMADEANGLARRRKVTHNAPRSTGQRRTVDAISFSLTNTVLEYLVHRHLRLPGKGRKAKPHLSYPDFLIILRERYGFYIDQSPPNMQVPAELLQRNRRHLERRLRDLGLLSGVNDAERMKKLKPRYVAAQDGIGADMRGDTI